jgi:hypothetical protein
MLAAYSYSAPLLNKLAKMEGRSWLASNAYRLLSQGAKTLSERVLLLRAVAWLGWIGVVITVVDLSYSGYRWYVNYTELTRWLSRCTFRRDKTNKNFSTIKDELEEFHKAQHPEPEDAEPQIPAAPHRSVA